MMTEYKMNEIMQPTKDKQQLNSWSTLPFRQKLKILDWWDLVIVASNFCHITSVLLEIFPVEETRL